MGKADEYIKNFLDDAARKNFENVETIEEKQLIALLMIRNNLKDIRNWATYFGIISVLGLLLGFYFVAMLN